MPPNSQAPKGTMANPWVEEIDDGSVVSFYKDDLGTWWQEWHYPDGTGFLEFTEACPRIEGGKATWHDANWHTVGPGTDYPDKEPMGYISQYQENPSPFEAQEAPPPFPRLLTLRRAPIG
jgi:hypothetical protein